MFLHGVAVVFLLGLVFANGEDSNPPHREYLRALESLPTLFNHIIGMLQDKPEVLEKNDITSFLESALASDVDMNPREVGLNVFKRQANFDQMNDNEQAYDWSLLKADGDSEAFVGSTPGASQFTAEDVAEKILMAERKLEEYHDTK